MRTRADADRGWWLPGGTPILEGYAHLRAALLRTSEAVYLLDDPDYPRIGVSGMYGTGSGDRPPGSHAVLATTPPCTPEQLGDPTFCRDHGIRFPYATGSMANGIAGTDLVESVSRAGLLGFFGAAGLGPARVEAAITRLQTTLGSRPFGFNLIHSPGDREIERAIAELYCRRGIRLVEASAYLDLTLPLVRYRVHGIHQDPGGEVVAPNRVIAKVSRTEVATRFMSPPPEKYLQELVAEGTITAEQARMAATLPVAQDVTAEADSGGHTDNRPAITLVPTMLSLAREIQARHGYRHPLRVGAAGGIATPAGVAAAFAMGAAYVMTGSVNQACRESASSDTVRSLLAAAGMADVTMAPAADMFEMGVKVQVLKRGTMFPMRAAKLHEVYRNHASLEDIPANIRQGLEKDIFRRPLESIWEETREFFERRDPGQVERAARDPRHKMALTFRWYLGLSSRWANSGEEGRQMDYQVWCGPAMGAFNEWARGSYLQSPSNRSVVDVAYNLLVGAVVTLRLQSLRQQGLRLPPEVTASVPIPMEAIQESLSGMTRRD